MSIVDSLEKVRAWVEGTVCDGALLKPMSVDGPQDEAWEYGLAEPSVYIMYLPPHENRPPGKVATVPAIVIEPEESRDDMGAQLRELRLRLSFTVWDPGVHGPDVLAPTDGTAFDAEPPAGMSLGPYLIGDGGTLRIDLDGWHAALSLMDRFLRIVENAGDIAGLELKQGEPIAFAPYNYADEGDLQFPFWACWCRLTLIEPFIRNHDVPETRNKRIESLL